MCHRAFTLIELLVVVTIIVVLLALLAPALDRAIYQAELATCGAQLKALAGQAVLYASASRRAYPYRVGARDPDWSEANLIRNATVTNGQIYWNFQLDTGGAWKAAYDWDARQGAYVFAGWVEEAMIGGVPRW